MFDGMMQIFSGQPAIGKVRVSMQLCAGLDVLAHGLPKVRAIHGWQNLATNRTTTLNHCHHRNFARIARAFAGRLAANRCRWSIEVFFKELKQTLQLADFLGHNANAVKWRVWTALLGLCAPALLCALDSVEPQLHPALRLDPLGPLAKLGTAQPAGSLWDN
jgi:hypothetical protein